MLSDPFLVLGDSFEEGEGKEEHVEDSDTDTVDSDEEFHKPFFILDRNEESEEGNGVEGLRWQRGRGLLKQVSFSYSRTQPHIDL